MYLTSPDFYKFLEENKDSDPLRLRLSKVSDSFDKNFAITQIECRIKCRQKLPFFISNKFFLFPDPTAAQQASHQAIARYHDHLAGADSKILDMTAGLGIDAMTLSFNQNRTVTAIELDEKKSDILMHNTEIFQLSNLTVINNDSITFLNNSADFFDLIFIDPSRRDTKNNRVFRFQDCSPDVVAYQELLTAHAKRVIIKASPLLDISKTLRDFRNLKSIRAIGVKGECKEILIEIGSNSYDVRKSQLINFGYGEETTPIILEAVNLDSKGNVISSFKITKDEEISSILYADPQDLKPDVYVLEPSPMMMKISPWNKICKEFEAKKFAPSSHLFISEKYPDKFPGRVCRFKHFITKKDRKSLSGFPASVVSRNHPLSSDEIRKVYNLKEGDSHFIYATRIGQKPVIFLSESITH